MNRLRLFFYLLLYSIITINTNASLHGSNLSEHSDDSLHSEELVSTGSYYDSIYSSDLESLDSLDPLEFKDISTVKKNSIKSNSIPEVLEPAIKIKFELENYITNLDVNLIAQAITNKAIKNSNGNYERLEFLGDAILGALTAHILSIDYNNKDTQTLFIKYTSNKHLTEKFKNLVNDTIEIYKEYPKSSKLWADIIESLIGCMFIHLYDKSNNNEKVNIHPILRFIIDYVEVKSSVSEERLFKLAYLYNLSDISLIENTLEALKSLESLLDYKFNNKFILIEALNNKLSRKKLSFLGQNILKLIVRNITYNQNPQSKPNKLTTQSQKLEKIIYASPFLRSTLKNNVLLLNKVKPKKRLVILVGSIYVDHPTLYKTSLGIDTKNKFVTSIILNNKINWN